MLSLLSFSRAPLRMAQYRPMAIAVLFPLPPGATPQSFLEAGLQRLAALPPDGLKAMRYMPIEPQSVLVSFHASRYVGIDKWKKRLTEAYGADFGALVNRKSVTETFEALKDDLQRFGVMTYYKTVGNRLEEDAERKEKRRKKTHKVAVAASVDESSQLEQVQVCNDGGVPHQVQMRQSRIELVPIQAAAVPALSQAAASLLEAAASLAEESAPLPEESAPLPEKSAPLTAEAPSRTLESTDLFTQGNYKKCLEDFLRHQRPYRIQSVAPMQPGENVNAYLRTANPQPMGGGVFHKIVPAVLRCKDAFKGIEGMDEEHCKILAKLNQFFRSYNWEGGLWTLCPMNDMQDYFYSVTKKIGTIGCSRFELVRRALKLEGAVACKIGELYDIVKHIPSMIVIPNVAQGIARLLLECNCGRLDDGAGYPFFLKEPIEDNVTRRLKKGVDKTTVDLLDYLKNERKAAFGALYPMESQLGWFMPTAAFLFHHRELLANMNKKSSAKALKDAIDEEWEKRRAAYWLGMERLAKYGAYLTRCVLLLCFLESSLDCISIDVIVRIFKTYPFSSQFCDAYQDLMRGVFRVQDPRG